MMQSRAERAAYMREYNRRHRYLIMLQRHLRRLDQRAGVRPGGGCVKCELWAGCGGLFCAAERKDQS